VGIVQKAAHARQTFFFAAGMPDKEKVSSACAGIRSLIAGMSLLPANCTYPYGTYASPIETGRKAYTEDDHLPDLLQVKPVDK
jgi:hypothetical protein